MKNQNKKIQITAYSDGTMQKLEAEAGNNLLKILNKNEIQVYSPCGGNGTCGKCKVLLKGEGYVTSCVYTLEEDIEIVLPGALEASILASQYEHSRAVPLSPGNYDELSSFPLGVAIDIGTTTLVFHFVQLLTGVLVETRTVMNPQGKYGADVISRINYTIMEPGGLKILQEELLKVINSELNHFTEMQGVSKDEIVKLTVTGNTTMLHLLLGENPQSLAFVPFTPVFTDERIHNASDSSLKANPNGKLIVLPSLAAYLGADILAGIASLAPDEKIRNYLFIDIGTNGEMALVTPEKIYSCAAAAGPAFEGANIEHGMPAMEGAINIFEGPGEFKTIGGSKPAGICGSGLIDLVATLVKKDIIKKDGMLEYDYEIVPAEKSANGNPILLTQKDIREVQLAKSAIITGIKILVKQAGLDEESIDALYLAGGFGNYIRKESAIAIGLLPLELKEKIIPVGNASGTGALLALKSEVFMEIIKEIKQRMVFIELSEHEDFVMEFAMNMGFELNQP
jgi:uncharacterized 2Fe-2S/4Fe-4S cluster protein (DUF4445 family)